MDSHSAMIRDIPAIQLTNKIIFSDIITQELKKTYEEQLQHHIFSFLASQRTFKPNFIQQPNKDTTKLYLNFLQDYNKLPLPFQLTAPKVVHNQRQQERQEALSQYYYETLCHHQHHHLPNTTKRCRTFINQTFTDMIIHQNLTTDPSKDPDFHKVDMPPRITPERTLIDKPMNKQPNAALTFLDTCLYSSDQPEALTCTTVVQIDGGSALNMISSKLAYALQLPLQSTNVTASGLGGPTSVKKQCELYISFRDHNDIKKTLFIKTTCHLSDTMTIPLLLGSQTMTNVGIYPDYRTKDLEDRYCQIRDTYPKRI
jgi:hypothetical protein